MIELKLTLDDIGYEQLAQQMLPLVLDKVRASNPGGRLGMFLNMAAMLPPGAVAGMLASLPQESKDELAVMLLNANKGSIVEAAERYSAEKEIPLAIHSVEITRK